MKRIRILLMAFVAMFSVGMVSCEKDNDDNGDANTTVEWVDLGLPSGLLWANCNLGASAPEEYGNYYAWGDTSTKRVYNWRTYRYCTVDEVGDLQELTKYNSKLAWGDLDTLTILQAMDDAATAALGSEARIPTKEEWRELINNTIVKRVTLNGVEGRKFTASNGNSIFLPAAGVHIISLSNDGTQGYYWSSSLNKDVPYNAWHYEFYADRQYVNDRWRCNGYSVRPVRSAH